MCHIYPAALSSDATQLPHRSAVTHAVMSARAAQLLIADQVAAARRQQRISFGPASRAGSPVVPEASAQRDCCALGPSLCPLHGRRSHARALARRALSVAQAVRDLRLRLAARNTRSRADRPSRLAQPVPSLAEHDEYTLSQSAVAVHLAMLTVLMGSFAVVPALAVVPRAARRELALAGHAMPAVAGITDIADAVEILAPPSAQDWAPTVGTCGRRC
jgi:hypothetical protein